MPEAIMSKTIDIRIAENGRMILPRPVRELLGVVGAGIIVLSVDGDEVKLTSIQKSIQKAQALYSAHVANDQSSEQFLETRRLEAALENTK